jgi:hypothetical protein
LAYFIAGDLYLNFEEILVFNSLQTLIMKKTFFLSLLAFLIVQGCTKGDDFSPANPNEPQLKSESIPSSAGKATITHFETYYNLDFYLWCDNKLIDHFLGDMNLHCVMQYENDVLLFMNMYYSGTYTAESTGEVFKFNETNMFNLSHSVNSNFHMNVIGSKGSHYIISGTYLTEEPWVVIDKAMCE